MSIPNDPFNRPHLNADLERMLRTLGHMGVPVRDEESNVATSHWMPPVDIREDGDCFLIIADVPGVEANHIEVSMAEGMLSIKGQREPEPEEQRKTYSRMERPRGSFHRRFSLPDTANPDQISARSVDGVLTITIPKRDLAAPRKIEVSS